MGIALNRVQPEAVTLTNEEILRYSRHLIMPEVALEGQKKLKAASVLLIGTGGLGSPLALYLAAAGIGKIGLVDYDVVDATNLHRQVIHGESTRGMLKVDSARRRMLDLNPDIEVVTYNEPFTSENALRIAADYDVLVDGTDNFPTRYLVNDVSVLLGTETIKLILGIGSSLIGRLMLYDALAMSFEEVKLRKNPRCVICGEHPTVTGLIDYEQFCGVPGHDHEAESTSSWDLPVTDLAARLKAGDDLKIIDVREPHEWQISHIEGAHLIPLGELAGRMHELDSAKTYVLQCKSGVRSMKALELLYTAGFRRLYNLKGGINAWAREVDHRVPVY